MDYALISKQKVSKTRPRLAHSSRTELSRRVKPTPPYWKQSDNQSGHSDLFDNTSDPLSTIASVSTVKADSRATSRPPQIVFDAFMSSKSRILSFVLDPNAQPQNRGIKAAAWKFVQKVLLVGTRAPPADPRVSQKRVKLSVAAERRCARCQHSNDWTQQPVECGPIGGRGKDASDSARHPNVFRNVGTAAIRAESSDPAILHGIFNTIPVLCKARQPLANLLVPSMAAWTPAALEAGVKPPMQIRAVERALRAVMGHLGRWVRVRR